MGLFDKKETPSIKPDGEAKTTTQQESIKNLSGFKSLDDVAKSAQDSIDSFKTSGKRPSSKLSKAAQEALAAQEKEQRQKQAMETLGKFFCRELTSVPYDIWAYAWDEPDLKLSAEEHAKLTEALFLTIQGFDLDLTSPWKALLGFGLFNVAFVGKRVKLIQAHKAEQEAAELGVDIDKSEPPKPN